MTQPADHHSEYTRGSMYVMRSSRSTRHRGSISPWCGLDRVKYWEPEDLVEFFDRAAATVSGHCSNSPRTRACGVVRSPVFTGPMLTWRAAEIVVRHNRVSVDGRVQETTTKTRSGRRTVPLSDAAVAALLTWQLRQSEEREAAQEAWQTQGHVFTMEDGRPLDPAYVTRLFQKIRLQGEPLPELTFHGLRHSAGQLGWPRERTSASCPSCAGTPRSRSQQTSTRTCSRASVTRP